MREGELTCLFGWNAEKLGLAFCCFLIRVQSPNFQPHYGNYKEKQQVENMLFVVWKWPVVIVKDVCSSVRDNRGCE